MMGSLLRDRPEMALNQASHRPQETAFSSQAGLSLSQQSKERVWQVLFFLYFSEILLQIFTRFLITLKCRVERISVFRLIRDRFHIFSIYEIRQLYSNPGAATLTDCICEQIC